MQWYQKAAADKDVAAMKHIGDLYSKGDGAKKNMLTAISWWKKAAALGNKDATDALKKNGK
jgi:TPR repeat protein